MDTVVVKSRFSGHAYLMALLFIFIVGLIFFISYKYPDSDLSVWSFIFLFGILFLCSLKLYHFIVRYLFKVVIYNSGIEICFIHKKEFIRWNEIKHLKLTGKYFVFLGVTSYSYECSEVKTRDGKIFPILYNNYSNYDAIVRGLEVVNLKRGFDDLKGNFRLFEIPPDLDKEKFTLPDRSSFTRYGKFPFLSFRGGLFFVLFLVLTIFGVRFITTNLYAADGYLVMGIGILMLFISGLFEYYFLWSGDYLVVRNPVFFWKEKIYKSEYIREVVLEEPYRSPISLRVITKDFKTKVYAADSLSKKTWIALADTLRKKIKKVRDEIDR